MSTTGMRIEHAAVSAGTISAGELFEQQRERLQLRWIAGAEGATRRLEAGDTVARRPSLAGYLNAIYPNKVQILGTEQRGQGHRVPGGGCGAGDQAKSPLRAALSLRRSPSTCFSLCLTSSRSSLSASRSIAA